MNFRRIQKWELVGVKTIKVRIIFDCTKKLNIPFKLLISENKKRVPTWDI